MPEDRPVIREATHSLAALACTLALSAVPRAFAGTDPAPSACAASIAAEADAISFFIGGYSGIVNLSLANGFQAALGAAGYDVPGFLLEGDANYDAAKWKATSTSVQVLRMGYRFNGPMKNGPALAAVVLNQNWRLHSEPLGGSTRFRPVSMGLSGGYYFHIGEHFYLDPTAALTFNRVHSGETSVGGTNYKVEKFGPNASLHAGWEWGLERPDEPAGRGGGGADRRLGAHRVRHRVHRRLQLPRGHVRLPRRARSPGRAGAAAAGRAGHDRPGGLGVLRHDPAAARARRGRNHDRAAPRGSRRRPGRRSIRR